MRILLFFLFVFFYNSHSQNEISIKKIETVRADKKNKLIEIDNLGNNYFLNENELYKGNELLFSDLSLGIISKVDVFNPMKIKLWYGKYNTLIILDNYLNEITRINFSDINYNYEISNMSSANDNFVWLFDELSLKIKKFDFIKKSFLDGIEIRLKNPLIDLKSDKKFLWVLTESFFMKYNYNGALMYKFKNRGHKKINFFKNDIILSGENMLTYFNTNQNLFSDILLDKLFIKDFFVVNETLYIYDEDLLYKYITLTY
tara:strand:- start:14258 stop:15034 length:777 start_codon:yes stop_codon:yes gene_type:complete